ncbi:MAG: hypothetical protein WDW36_008302 [Sanguina aurantia]
MADDRRRSRPMAIGGDRRGRLRRRWVSRHRRRLAPQVLTLLSAGDLPVELRSHALRLHAGHRAAMAIASRNARARIARRRNAARSDRASARGAEPARASARDADESGAAPLAVFIRRPADRRARVAILLSGMLAAWTSPAVRRCAITFPVIVVQASMAGASPDIMASTVAAPLERRLGTIADVSTLTSTSSAAIQAARADLPTTLRNNPTYREYNPADSPIMVLALTSNTLTRAQLYDSADSVIQQQLSQVDGVGQITLGGSALPSVRVELEPDKLNSYGIGLEDVRAAISAANANSAKGHIDQGNQRYEVMSNDQINKAAPYRDLILAYRNNAAVKLGDVADVQDSAENIRNAGLYNGKDAVLVIVFPVPGGNIVKTVAQIRKVLPSIEATLPHDVHVGIAVDRSQSVNAAVGDTERTLFIAVLLVIGVVFIFLQSPRAILVPAVALPLSIVGTFGPMYLLGYSIDNLSLMALTIGTGFVVDDAVVVLENIVRHVEGGMDVKEAALVGSAEVSFTVISMSLSLIAVFLPILLMPGIVGLLFHEFAVTLSIAILVAGQAPTCTNRHMRRSAPATRSWVSVSHVSGTPHALQAHICP